MTTILGLSGSLRRASFNSGLLRAAAALAPEGVEITIGSIRDVPLYDGDREEAGGLPESVRRLQAQLAASDGLLLVSPEYNSAVPGVLKNALDWMSRGDGFGAFNGKPVAVAGASPGRFGTAFAQDHWLPMLRALKTRPWLQGRLIVAGAEDLFDDAGTLTDDKTCRQVARFVEGFAASL